MKTTHDKIMVKEIAEEKISHGGIYVPSVANIQIKKGLVVEVGPGRLNSKGERDPMSVKVDETIHYETHAGMHVKFK